MAFPVADVSDDAGDPEGEGNRGQIGGPSELESGLLARFRQWTDLFPWIRLGKTLRVAGSPPLLGLVALAWFVQTTGQGLWLEPGSAGLGSAGLGSAGLGSAGLGATPLDVSDFLSQTQQTLSVFGQCVWSLNPISLVLGNPRAAFGRSLLSLAWSLLVWIPVALLLVRQGALLTAARPITSLTNGLRQAVRRTPSAWVIAMTPIVCIGMIAFLIAVCGWCGQGFDSLWWQRAWGAASALFALPCGILAFGSVIAIPLGWAALANEPDPDALDSLSRGYECLYRRPLNVALYATICLVILVVIHMIASGISHAALTVASHTLTLSGAPSGTAEAAVRMLAKLPLIVDLTVFWSLFGGCYLLLRQDTGGQEVEDLWLPSADSKPKLPSLK